MVKRFLAMEKMPFSLRNLNFSQLEEWILARGFPKFRTKQVFQWLWRSNVFDADKMHTLPKDLRQIIELEGNINLLQRVSRIDSRLDASSKLLLKLNDGNLIESVLITEDKRNTVCVSTQVGCALGCTFCRTGSMGFVRNLSSGEILSQLLLISRLSANPVTNVVFMGMGEPFLNFDALIEAAKMMNDPRAFNLSARRISISTAGIIPGIEQLSLLPWQFKLAISLNAIFPELRETLMPISKKYSLDNLLKAAKSYTEKSGKLVMFEYVLIDGVNDRDEDAAELKRRLKDIPCKINLIPFNSIATAMQRPSPQRIRRFISNLENAPFPVIVRHSGGTDINAACGQLLTNYNMEK
ncbi:MAG TPA: 23S rRNA (adenine(2503)-C(2))-methyltransferase RlmN [Candidatus Marinimicrobia bacterium]|nr:23S rRNA (adenine(2503)-C(2))-methyltransferase RlmN [Candidatus Neomarinimicrobiota bacterium]